MTQNQKVLWQLFTSTFYLSTFTFGGGYVIVPLMKKRFVEELKWINEDEMLELVAIGQSAPGPIAVNASVLVGYRIAGVKGAIVSALGTILPPLIIMTIVTYFYIEFRDNLLVQNLLRGMQAGIAAIIVKVVYDMGKRIIEDRKIMPIIIMIFSLIAGLIFNLNVIYILLVAAIIGVLTSFFTEKGGKPQ